MAVTLMVVRWWDVTKLAARLRIHLMELVSLAKYGSHREALYLRTDHRREMHAASLSLYGQLFDVTH